LAVLVCCDEIGTQSLLTGTFDDSCRDQRSADAIWHITNATARNLILKKKEREKKRKLLHQSTT
jgi:hypothetical protein